MNSNKKTVITQLTENVIRIAVFVLLAISLVIMIIAIFDRNVGREASIGSFNAHDFNDGWQIKSENGVSNITLPTIVSAEEGNELVITNTLPSYISNGMNIMIRSSMEDMVIFIDGKKRNEYSTRTIDNVSYHIPSAFIVTQLYNIDAGKEIEIHINVKKKAAINAVKISYGNNAWFEIIKSSIYVNFAAVSLFILGLMVAFPSMYLGGVFELSAVKHLGFLITTAAGWILSESMIRQLLFKRASFATYFSFILVEMLGAMACRYFDEVQHGVYHKRYLILESLVLLQILVNVLLHAGGVAELYDTMVYSQIWNLVCAVVSVINIINDFITKRVKEYHFTAIGMIGFILMGVLEMSAFYLNKFHVFGTEICIGLLMLLLFTVIQAAYDEYKNYNKREQNYADMTITTIETIASAIDAKDEYTGGHSERVGFYAERLAREMAADYDLTEEDILRIHYIGLVHDIGKIGVADDVLNKAGMLSAEELSLMKMHTEIGYEIMESLGGGIEGLLDGIRYHHERFDGTGYPDGLSYTDIPLVARILALADSYDAMTSNRVYRLRLTDEQARNEIEKCAGTQFDPTLAKMFIELIDAGEISALTMEGSAVDKEGNVRNSARLELRIQEDIFKEIEVINPTHGRMLCYVMKLMEKKGKDYQIAFFEAGNKFASYRTIVRDNTSPHDINIQYTQTSFIVALYNKTEEELEEFITTIKEKCPDITASKL